MLIVIHYGCQINSPGYAMDYDIDCYVSFVHTQKMFQKENNKIRIKLIKLADSKQ